MPPTPLRQRAVEEGHTLALHLKQFLVEEGLVVKELSSRLGRAPQYLGRVFAGRFPLKLKDLFGTFELLGKNPRRFLFRFYPPGGSLETALHPKNLAKLGGGTLFAELIERHLFGEAPLPARLVVERAARVLRGMIASSPKTQRAIGRELGMPQDSLSQALRLRTGLDAWHVFGILAATGNPPARFFHQITEPESQTLDSEIFRRATVLATRPAPPTTSKEALGKSRRPKAKQAKAGKAKTGATRKKTLPAKTVARKKPVSKAQPAPRPKTPKSRSR